MNGIAAMVSIMRVVSEKEINGFARKMNQISGGIGFGQVSAARPWKRSHESIDAPMFCE